MKKALLIGCCAILLGCQPGGGAEKKAETVEMTAATGWKTYGAEINGEGAVEAVSLPSLAAGQDSLVVKVKGEALSSCSKKGCWMKVAVGEGEEMRVSFKDYAFFVPKDLQGEEVIFEGVLTQKVNDVETLRHYAKDEGASEEELMQITEPQKEYSFEATGVLLKR